MPQHHINCINAALSGYAASPRTLRRNSLAVQGKIVYKKNVNGILNRRGTGDQIRRWRRTVFSQLRPTKEMFALLVVTLEEGMRRFDKFKRDYNYSGTSNFDTDKPECYASLTDNFAWDQSVDAHGGWAQAPNRQPAHQSECPAMGLSIPHDFFTS